MTTTNGEAAPAASSTNLSYSEKPNTTAPYLGASPDVTFMEGSTRAPSTVEEPEKKLVDDNISTGGNETDNATVVAAGSDSEEIAGGEYPSGFQLGMVIVALVLSIFLVALDMPGFAAPPKQRPLFTGVIGGAYGLASVVGPLVGGALSDHATWRWCFYINLPIGGVSAAMILFFFTTPSQAKPIAAPFREKILQMDPIGCALIMAGVISYILAFQYAGVTHAWNSPTVIGLIVGFILIFITFGVWEYYNGERSMITPRLFKHRTVWVGSLYIFFLAGSYFVLVYYLPLYFQSIDDQSPTQSGVRNLPLILGVTIATIASGGAVTATGIAAPIAVGAGAIATVAAGLLYTLDIGTGSGKWIGYQVLAGLAYGAGFQIPIIVGQASSAPEDLSSVTAIILFFQTIGGAIFVSAAQSAFINKTINTAAELAPEVSPLMIVGTGATQLRVAFADNLDEILLAYMQGLKVAFAIATAGVGASFVISLFSSWRRLNTAAIKESGGAA
ncbi:putative HC-toxin efflux carrier [Rhypophila sp. PSN 637]